MIDETVRLYSRPTRTPEDAIAPQHLQIHADLDRWGAWNRDRYHPGTCASIEKNYDARGHREMVRGIVSKPINPMNRRLDRTVRYMVIEVPQHAQTIKLFYVTRPVRRDVMRKGRTISVPCSTPEAICQTLCVHWSDFGKWMFDCRAMVINIMREIAHGD